MNKQTLQDDKPIEGQHHYKNYDKLRALLKLCLTWPIVIIFSCICLGIFLTWYFTTVSQNAQNVVKIIHVEDIGTDAAAIQVAIDRAGDNGVVMLSPGRIYTQTNSLVLKYNGIKIIGNNATLKRGNQETTILTEPCDSISTHIHVASVPSGWKEGDGIQIYTDSTYFTSNIWGYISSIVGTTINLKSVVGINAGSRASTWGKGSIVRKVYSQIIVPENFSYTIEDLIIDGNRSNNKGNYYWAVNTAVNSYGAAKINRCKFIEIPNENIVGVGFTVTNCYAKNLNGSFVHESSSNIFTDKSKYYSQISDNLTDSTNLQSSFKVTGHSEGVITFSATSGRQNFNNNYFFNGGDCILGNICAQSETAGGTRDFIFTDNFCSGYRGIISNLWNSGLPNKAGNFVITNNVFKDCGNNDYATADIISYDTINITGNHIWGNTTWTNIPEEATLVQDFVTNHITLGKPKTLASVSTAYPSGDLVFNSTSLRQVDGTYNSRQMKIRAVGQNNYWGLPKLSIIGLSDWKDEESEMLSIDANNQSITTPFDLDITTNTKGIILKSPDGNKWRITVENDGALKASSISK